MKLAVSALSAGLAASCGFFITDVEDPPCVRGGEDVEAVDLGVFCAGAAVDAVVFDGLAVSVAAVAPLPASLDIVLVDGVWRLQGTAPDGAAAFDGSFDISVEREVDDCLERSSPARVTFLVDTCEVGSCGAFTRPSQLAGFCLPSVINADVAFDIEVRTADCLSSSCTEVRPPVCDIVVTGGRVDVGGDSCVRDRAVDGCSEDCGGGTTTCTLPPLPAGDYVVATASGELNLQVPSSSDVGRCVEVNN